MTWYCDGSEAGSEGLVIRKEAVLYYWRIPIVIRGARVLYKESGKMRTTR